MNRLQTITRRLSQYMLLAFLVLGITACDSNIAGTEATAEPDLITRVSSSNFATLAAAVDAAELTATLRADGPFTVFAPTDEAFAKLPESALRTLLLPENKGQLAELIAAHVVPGRVLASDVAALTAAKSLDGTDLDFRQEEGTIFVNDARIMATDIQASNGVVHAIDSVMLPEWFDEWFSRSDFDVDLLID